MTDAAKKLKPDVSKVAAKKGVKRPRSTKAAPENGDLFPETKKSPRKASSKAVAPVKRAKAVSPAAAAKAAVKAAERAAKARAREKARAAKVKAKAQAKAARTAAAALLRKEAASAKAKQKAEERAARAKDTAQKNAAKNALRQEKALARALAKSQRAAKTQAAQAARLARAEAAQRKLAAKTAAREAKENARHKARLQKEEAKARAVAEKAAKKAAAEKAANERKKALRIAAEKAKQLREEKEFVKYVEGKELPRDVEALDYADRPMIWRDLIEFKDRHERTVADTVYDLVLLTGHAYSASIKKNTVVPFDLELLARLYDHIPESCAWKRPTVLGVFDLLYGADLEAFRGNDEHYQAAQLTLGRRYARLVGRADTAQYRWLSAEGGKITRRLANVLSKIQTLAERSNRPREEFEKLSKKIWTLRGYNLEKFFPMPTAENVVRPEGTRGRNLATKKVAPPPVSGEYKGGAFF